MSLSVGYGGTGSVLSTAASNLATNLANNLQGKGALPKDGKEESATQSVIGAAEITITGTGDAKKDEESNKTLATLTSRDPATANAPLMNNLTLQQAQELQNKIRKEQENQLAAKLVGAVLSNVVGDLAKGRWPDGSPEKIALHGLAGLIQAKLGDAKALSGTVVGMANEYMTPIMAGFLKDTRNTCAASSSTMPNTTET